MIVSAIDRNFEGNRLQNFMDRVVTVILMVTAVVTSTQKPVTNVYQCIIPKIDEW